jgi:hypothetical protein
MRIAEMLELDRTTRKLNGEDDLEIALFSSLNEVEPDPEFVTRLKGRFEQSPTMVLETRTFWEIYVIVATGLFLGSFLIWLIQHLVRKGSARKG